MSRRCSYVSLANSSVHPHFHCYLASPLIITLTHYCLSTNCDGLGFRIKVFYLVIFLIILGVWKYSWVCLLQFFTFQLECFFILFDCSALATCIHSYSLESYFKNKFHPWNLQLNPLSSVSNSYPTFILTSFSLFFYITSPIILLLLIKLFNSDFQKIF